MAPIGKTNACIQKNSQNGVVMQVTKYIQEKLLRVRKKFVQPSLVFLKIEAIALDAEKARGTPVRKFFSKSVQSIAEDDLPKA